MDLLFSSITSTLSLVPGSELVTQQIETRVVPPLRQLQTWLFGDEKHPPHEFVCKPTILLCLACLFIWVISVTCGVFLLPRLPSASWGWVVGHLACFLLCSLASFFQFTVAHDAAHGAISKRYPIVNEVLGRISAFFLYPAPYGAWQAMHHAHHKFTNDPSRDPDYWTSHGTSPVVFRCATQVFAYAVFYLGPFHKTRPRLEVIEFYLQMALYVSLPFLVYSFAGFFWFRAMFEFWIIPSLFALTFLTLLLDLIPHAHRDETPQTNCFKTTTFIDSGIDHSEEDPTWASWIPRSMITLMCQFQDFHHVHHLNPSLPFFLCIPKHHEKIGLWQQKGLPRASFASSIEGALGLNSPQDQDQDQDQDEEQDEEGIKEE